MGVTQVRIVLLVIVLCLHYYHVTLCTDSYAVILISALNHPVCWKAHDHNMNVIVDL